MSLDLTDHAAIAGFCKLMNIGLVVVGPEAPLVAGIVDDLAAAGMRVSARARPRPGSKAPRPSPRSFARVTQSRPRGTRPSRTPPPRKAYARDRGAPIVIKADGLAAGKGVVIAATMAEAEATIDRMFSGDFGRAGEPS